MKSLIYYSLIIIICFSCSPLNYNKVVGCYYCDTLMLYSFLSLKVDSTYNFKTTGDMINVFQTGNWQIHGNKIILNSFIQPSTKGYFNEEYDKTINKKEFYLYELGNLNIESLEFITITQGDSIFKLDSISKHLFVLNRSNYIDFEKSFTIYTDNVYNKIKVNPRNKSSNKFKLYLVKNCNGFFQSNEKYKFKKGKLIRKPFIFQNTSIP